MQNRKCRVFIDGEANEATFHQFGTNIIHGSDNEPREESVGIVELESGQIKMVKPDKIKFHEPSK